jgi:hypothetical protein
MKLLNHLGDGVDIEKEQISGDFGRHWISGN